MPFPSGLVGFQSNQIHPSTADSGCGDRRTRSRYACSLAALERFRLPAVLLVRFGFRLAMTSSNDRYDAPVGWQFRTSRISIEKHERTRRSSQLHFLRGELISLTTLSIRVLRQR